MATDEVKMTFRAPERAATIEPVTPDGEDALDYLCLVMPLRLLD
jgi:DNA polymerase-3 subunit beta